MTIRHLQTSLAAAMLLLLGGLAARICAAASPVDEAQVRAAGIRKLESHRLTLYTDVPSAPEVDELPQVFDQAFELWCKYLGIDPLRHGNWHMRASLIDDQKKFQSCGLMPADVP